ncbi:hypothetical protein AGLY_015017 [Aphis glycines]|uniref:Uncharacterized protein n=1 Tax=Aphis glycines TaxID=307491 RepID=A0A6G0T4Y7_APHGL|nr:hypothetical protein AGLY_015017 [Aphis glycines]
MVVKGKSGRKKRAKDYATPLELARKRVPKGGVVIIRQPTQGVSYADITRKVKVHVRLKELDLKPIARVTKSGTILLKVQDDKEADPGEGSIVDRVHNEEYNHSDHFYVTYDLASYANAQPVSNDHVFRGWDTTKGINHDLLEVGLLIADWLNPVSDHRGRDVHNLAEVLEDNISAACNIALPRRSASTPARKPVHWWDTEISALRKGSTSAKRNKTRLVARAKRLQTHPINPNTNEAIVEAAEAVEQLRKYKKVLKLQSQKAKNPVETI